MLSILYQRLKMENDSMELRNVDPESMLKITKELLLEMAKDLSSASADPNDTFNFKKPTNLKK